MGCGVSSKLKKIEEAIWSTWPWLDRQDSLGKSWVCDRAKAIECGYCPNDDESYYNLIGSVGMEDAVFLFDETDQPCMYTRCEELQKALRDRGVKVTLEPYYSFLWLIWDDELHLYPEYDGPAAGGAV